MIENSFCFVFIIKMAGKSTRRRRRRRSIQACIIESSKVEE